MASPSATMSKEQGVGGRGFMSTMCNKASGEVGESSLNGDGHWQTMKDPKHVEQKHGK
jgi:hypothetical protein